MAVMQSGFVVWLTGLPASGKTSLAYAMQAELVAQEKIQTVVLDSDELRAVLTPDPAYSATERDWFYGVVTYLAAWLARDGVNVLIAATANRRRYRDEARRQIVRFAEVHVVCSLAECRARDPKGIYKRAQMGEATSVPGVGADYEGPLRAETAVNTTTMLPEEAAVFVIAQLQGQGIIEVG